MLKLIAAAEKDGALKRKACLYTVQAEYVLYNETQGYIRSIIITHTKYVKEFYSK